MKRVGGLEKMSTETLMASFVGALVTIYTTVIASTIRGLRNQVKKLQNDVEKCHQIREREKSRRMRLEHEVRHLMDKLGMEPPDWPEEDSEPDGGKPEEDSEPDGGKNE